MFLCQKGVVLSMFGSITRKANVLEPGQVAKLEAEVYRVNAEVVGLRAEVAALKRAQVLLDAQFEELIDKAYRKWSRARMEIVREPEQAEEIKSKNKRARPLPLSEMLRTASQKVER